MPQIQADVVVLGSGIGGSTVAALLARQGIRTAVIDSALHPRFALGESTIGETSFLMRILAARYDVPELGLASTNHGLEARVSRRCGVKRNFGFVYQHEGREHAPDEVTQCNVSDGPFGPEAHLMRADLDQYLFEAAKRHGALAYEGVTVEDIALDDGGVDVRLSQGDELRAAYVVDATGCDSVLAKQFGLREEPSRFRTQSRTIFTHMRNVRPYDQVDSRTRQPTPWHEGTLHHLFDGGWMWVIPFDNRKGSESDFVSVGLNLDCARFPKQPGITAEQEWQAFLRSQPGIAGQFENAEAAFPWISTGRTQFSSAKTVGDRWVLMSHAAGAVDALFSRGMANTMAVIEAFVPRFLEAHAAGDYRAGRLAYVGRLSQTLLNNNDKLVAGSYVAFRDFDLWRAWSKMWFLAWNLGVMRLAGAYYRYVETGDAAVLDELHKGELPGAFAPEAPSAQEQFERCFAIMESIDRGEMEIEDAIPEMAFILGHGEASPAPLNLHDVLRPWHDGSAETQTLIYNWGRMASPAGMRKWFDYDRATIPLAARRVHACLAVPLAAEWAAMSRLSFGMLMFPIHNPAHDPILQLDQDIALAEHADRLGFDEFWFGEHHSGGWQIIADPLLMVARAAATTRRIRLGSGVSTLAYHHPKLLLESAIQLDHMTRGRFMFGVGAGALALDSLMLGQDPMAARAAMEESMEAMMLLLRGDGPVTYTPQHASWRLVDAYLQLQPFSEALDIRVAVFNSASGPRLAGRWGLGMVSFGASAAVGLARENRMALAMEKAQGKAEEHGQALDRRRWSAMSPIHVAPTEAQAREDVRFGISRHIDYIRQILPMNVPVDSDVDHIVDALHLAGHGVVGTPEMAVRHIERLVDLSGGIGTFLIEHADWAGFEQSKASMELFAREVAPRFTGGTRAREEAYQRELQHDQLTRRTMAKAQAAADLRHSREVGARRRASPPELTALPGGREPSSADSQAPASPPAAASIPERLRSLWTRTGRRAGAS